jgi:hypothetical protein
MSVWILKILDEFGTIGWEKVSVSGTGVTDYSELTGKPTLGTAAAKDVGSGTGNVADAVHSHAYSAITDRPTLGTAAAKDVGTGTGNVADAIHTHTGYVASNNAISGATNPKITYDAKGLVTAGAALISTDIPDISGTYSVIGHGHGLGTAAAKTVGDASTNLQENGAALNATQTVETDANKKFISVAKATGYNLATGTTSGTVATGDHGHSHTVLTDIGTNTHATIDAHIAIANPGDISSYRRNGATRPRWYTMPLACTALSVSGALTADRFYATPFYCPKAMTVDSISVNCTTLVAAGHLRVGIYNDTNGEPDGRLLDAGALDTSGTGVKTAATNQALLGGTLYWLVALSEKATHAFRAPALAGVLDVLGADATCPTTHITHFYASQAYGALPANFPAVTQGTGIVFPLIYVHASAGGK